MTCTFRQLIVFYYRGMTQYEKTSYHKHNKTQFCEENQQHALSCEKTFEISRAIVRAAPKMLSATEIRTVSTAKKISSRASKIYKKRVAS